MFSELSHKLYDLYKCNEAELYAVGERCMGKMHGPFLISPNSKFSSSKVRVIFIGQETNGWSSKSDIADQMETYSNFNLGEKYYSSPFWNVIRKFESSLIGDTYSSSWLNINRYDQNNKKPSNENLKILGKLDDLLLSELQILTPNITIFLTGHSYDRRIISLLDAKKKVVEGVNSKTICEYESSSITGRVFRTYHPNYLRRSRLENKVISEICSQVNI